MKNLAKLFKGISDPIRLNIVALLLEQKELCVCDLMAALQLPQSTTSRHLAYLKRSGWLTSRQEGLWSYYSISAALRTCNAEILQAVSVQIIKSGNILDAKKQLSDFLQYKRPC
jgi:ArsR family transcriptional regulator